MKETIDHQQNLLDFANTLLKNGQIKQIDNNFYLNNNEFEISLGFEDVAIKQKKNVLSSRLNADTSAEFVRGIDLKIPLLASNMDTVTNADFCIQLSKLGALGIMHRVGNIIPEIRKISENCEVTAASIGINDEVLLKQLVNAGANVIFIDIAHGYSDSLINYGRKIKKEYKHIKLVLGNTTNIDMLHEVDDFADGVKVGIAQGFACETKNTAGCTEKQFSAILKFKEISKKLGLPIISDGGIREPADFTKSMAAGANSAMAGMIFARCPESAAPLIELDGKKKKVYQGMASRAVQDRWRGGLKDGTCPEGATRYLDLGESISDLLERYSGALRSGITYAGATGIKSLQEKAEFVRFK